MSGTPIFVITSGNTATFPDCGDQCGCTHGSQRTVTK